MGIVKRACLYIYRKKVRTFILFVIIMSMGLFMLVGVSIRSSASKAAQDIRKTITTGLVMNMIEISGDQVFKLVPNEKGEMVRTLKVPLLTRSQLDKLLDIEGVKGYYNNQGHEIAYTGLDVHPGGYAATLKEAKENIANNQGGFTEEDISSSEKWSHANGFYIVYEGKWHPFFTNGALELTAGRHIEEGDIGKAVISEELAERNGLGIGDKIKSYNFDYITGELYGSAFDSEIVGIFRINFQQDLSNWTSEDQILANAVFVDPEMRYWSQVQHNTQLKRQIIGRESYDILDNLTLYVDDPLTLDSVKEEILDIDSVDWSYYSFKEYDHDYKATAGPLNHMVMLSTALIVVMAVGLIVILSLILAMWIRSRKREIGILTSLGMTKYTILAQLILECCIIAVTGFLVAGILAKPVTTVIGNTIEGSVNESTGKEPYEVQIDKQSDNLSVNKIPSGQVALEYKLTPELAGAVFLVILVVIFFSVIISYGRIIGKKLRIP